LKKLAAAVFLLTILPSAADTRQAALTPYRHPVKNVVSAAEARKGYHELLRRIESVRNPAADTPNGGPAREPFDCPSLDERVRQCVGLEGLHLYLDEYLPYASNVPALVPDSTVSSTLEGGAAEPGWVPAEKVLGGQDVLKRLEDSLAKKELEDCEGEVGECRTVVEAIPAAKGERVLAVCDVAHVGEELGAVRNCEAVAVVAPGASYLRSVVGYTPRQGAPPKPDEWDTVAEYRVSRTDGDVPLPDLNKLLETLRGGLESWRWKLKAGLAPKENPTRVVAVAAPRISPLSGGFTWEKVSVVIEVRQEEGAPGGFTLRSSVVAQVQLKTGRPVPPEDIQRPTAEMSRIMEDAVDASIRMPLVRLCGGSHRWKDIQTLVCGDPHPPAESH
jgi:hypothetical protein